MPELHALDHNKRIDYCQWFNENLRNDEVLNLSFFSDEAWFHLSGYVNSQNYRIWSAENPHVYHETQLHPVKIGVWVGMSRRRIIGPIFFENTITAANYHGILNRFIEQLHDDEITTGFFQHDNATPHTARQTIQYLEQFYGNRLISNNRWPPRSPDLTPLDFFLFGYLKDTIFRNRLHTIDEMKEAIRTAIDRITPEVLENVFEGMKRRIDTCLQNNGGHIDNNL